MKTKHETQRLSLRKLTINDVDYWMEYFNSEEALKFIGLKTGDRNSCLELINKQIARYGAHEFDGLHALIEKTSGEMVG